MSLANLARMTTATTGTGTMTLGSAVSSYLTFALAGITDGQVVSYAIVDGADREVGRGVYTASGTTLTRTVIKSTNGDAAISLSGAAEVLITALKEDFFRGARVKKTADETAVNATAGYDLYFDAADFDDGGLWLGANFTFATTDVDTATDTITETAHGMTTGQGPVEFSSSTTLPAGLSAATNYWIIRVDANSFKPASSRANSLANTPVDITTQGTGTHTCKRGHIFYIGPGISRVVLTAVLATNSDAADRWHTSQILKNAALAVADDTGQEGGAASYGATISSGPVDVVEGDYFKFRIATEADASITLQGTGNNICQFAIDVRA